MSSIDVQSAPGTGIPPRVAAQSPKASAQRGMALVSALLLLVVVTIIAVSMFRSYGMQEKIAGNTREKQRALNAAVSAQQYAEWYLKNVTLPPSAACTGVVSASVGQVCTNPLTDFTLVPWNIGVTYTPFTSNPVNGTTQQVTGTAPPVAGSYYQPPMFYITDLGHQAGSTTTEIYQIDAVGYGGTSNAVAVVESTFMIKGGSTTPLDSAVGG